MKNKRIVPYHIKTALTAMTTIHTGRSTVNVRV